MFNVELTIDRKQCKGTAEFQWPSARKKESRTEIYHRPIHKTQKVTNRIYHTSKQTREPIGRGTQYGKQIITVSSVMICMSFTT